MFLRLGQPAVWNMTRRCNLHCIHCYAGAGHTADERDLSTQEAKYLIDDLASFGAPVIIFSGGEPLLREDLMDLGSYAVLKGLRAVISTNGTLIEKDTALRIQDAGFGYVGISIDGLEKVNDNFRGQHGAFNRALRAIQTLRDIGVRTGLRFTLNSRNIKELPGVLNLMEVEGVPRLCVYHLVYSGRARSLIEEKLSHEETRKSVDLIFQHAMDYHKKGLDVEILTVDNHTDGPYLYLEVQKNQPGRASEVFDLLRMNGGNGSGTRIANIDPLGEVHADQFWWHYSFGNVRKRLFSEIWIDTSDPLMAALKEKKLHVKGRCCKCQFLDLCGGNFRVRAEAITGDVWAPDPACYLTDEEIGIAPPH